MQRTHLGAVGTRDTGAVVMGGGLNPRGGNGRFGGRCAKVVLARHPQALLLLVPRHPHRAASIEALLQAKGLRTARRSTNAPITAQTQVYIADTFGELGLWYALAAIAFVGGSFVRVGGHNPYEPAHAGCAILHGPQVANFHHAYADMHRHGACQAYLPPRNHSLAGPA